MSPEFDNRNIPPERLEEAHEIYRAIGRNIVLLQKIEQMLKFLAVNANISVPPAEMLAEQKKRLKRWKKGGLGALVDDYAKRVLVESIDDSADKGHFAITYNMSAPETFRKEIKARVGRIVKQRNELVHGLPYPWLPGKQAHFRELRDWLDRLSNELVAEWHNLRHQVMGFCQMAEILNAQLKSNFFELDEEGQRAWFADRGIQQEPPQH